MNKYEIIGLIETKKKEIKAFELEAEAVVSKIKKILNDSWWELSLSNAEWLKKKADELFRLMQRCEELKKQIESYKDLQKKIVLEEV